MKKIILLAVFALICTTTFSQEKKDAPKEGWTKKGNISFLFNQSAFSNWIAGGENNIAGNINLNYDFNYSKNMFTWNNRILASYGLTKGENTSFEKKTDDRFEYNLLMGLKANENWYYSLLFNFKTQFSKGYKYFKTPEGVEDRDEYTNFLSPAYFKLGPGMLWEKSANLKVNIAPATTKLIIVNKKYTEPENKYFGVEEGKNTRLELGFNASGYYKFNLMENISIENIISFYSNYLEDPQNIDIDYTMNIAMKINKYLSANIIVQTIYDDNAFEGFQIREIFGVGINYGF